MKKYMVELNEHEVKDILSMLDGAIDATENGYVWRAYLDLEQKLKRLEPTG